MAKIKFIGCLHLGDKTLVNKVNGLRLMDSEEHDEHLINSWNSAVNEDDLVYILGDISMEDPTQYEKLSRLKGKKYVVMGNHDLPQHAKELLDYVDGLCGMKYLEEDINGEIVKVWVSHAPLHPQELTFVDFNIHCVDKETEILTKNGWKRYNEIKVGDDIYSLNENGFLENDIIKNIIINPSYKGDLIEIKDRSTHLIYTDKHRIPFKSFLNGKTKWSTAKEIHLKNDSPVFLCSGVHINQNGINLSDQMLMLYISLAADGNYNKKTGLCRLNVNKKRKHNFFISILDELKIEYSVQSNKSAKYCVSFTLPEQLKEYNIKGLDEKILLCNKKQCKIIIESYKNTDGYKNGNSVHIFTSKYKEFDILTHLFTINGFKCNTYERIGSFENSGINYVISVIEKECVIKTNFKKISKIYKDDILVWCISSRNGNFISRRNGETYITGNCHIHHMKVPNSCVTVDYWGEKGLLSCSENIGYYNVDAHHINYIPKTIEDMLADGLKKRKKCCTLL